ncbi:MAG: SPASM domain-containing protein [Erysipelotrichaceae bacterium]|nr:SPASM domain-containing protein [Erysipelotrichaceae bacterium]
MKNISMMIKPSSASCNLRCRYCFYMDESKHRDVPSHGFMSDETVDVLISRIVEYLDGEGVANLSFQGGEPMLSGIGFFERLIEKMKAYPKIETHYSLQTNGTLITEEFARLFADNHFLIGVSLDGFEKNMNSFRVSSSIDNVFEAVLKGIELLKEHDVEYNILTVVTRELATHPRALMEFYLSEGFDYVQLIPCLPAFGVEDDGMSLTPELYASFYKSFFKQWKKAYLSGHYINVNLFENVGGMLQGYLPYQCGMIGRCNVQHVIEANGDVYPCDFYCLDEYLMGNVNDNTIEELRNSNGAKALMDGSECEKAPCKDCRFRNICHGGCQRQNLCYLKDDYCAYQNVLGEIVPELYELIRKEKK